jgi:menaquinone-dependent protoporphyrinogen oxidase
MADRREDTRSRAKVSSMTFMRLLQSWAEALVRIIIGMGIVWIGVVEDSGYGVLLEVVGTIFIAAGIAEVWFVEFAAQRLPLQRAMKHIHPALVRCELPVFYATTEGHTRRIAERLAAIFREMGFESRAIDAASSDADYTDWTGVRTVVGASLHMQRYQRAAEAFVRARVADLNLRPSAFFSVSLAVASQHPADREAAKWIAGALPASLGWHPNAIVCLAGRLAYTQYGIVTRFIMKQIARREGGPTDTSRDHELTNWDEVTQLAENVAQMIRGGAPGALHRHHTREGPHAGQRNHEHAGSNRWARGNGRRGVGKDAPLSHAASRRRRRRGPRTWPPVISAAITVKCSVPGAMSAI